MSKGYERRHALCDPLYERLGNLGDPCSYCGVESSGWDHVPPLHYIERITAEDRDDLVLRKVPSCGECNSLLGGAILPTIASRRLHVKEALRRKYAHLLRIPNWDEDELGELTGYTQQEVRSYSRVASHLKQRLGFYS